MVLEEGGIIVFLSLSAQWNHWYALKGKINKHWREGALLTFYILIAQ
jgi:hypothetical protein